MKPVIEVDLDAIRENYRTFADHLGVTIIPIVKAEAYGHGALAVAQTVIAAGAPMLGVADAREAIALRDAGIDTPILAWLHSPMQDWDATLAADLEIGVSSFDMLARIANRTPKSPDVTQRIHLKLDTGLGRNGIREVDWLGLFAYARELERRQALRVVGVMSHIAGAGEVEDRAQIERFERGVGAADHVGLRPETLHLCATGAALQYPEARYDAVRLGIGLYGLTPFGPDDDPGINLRPALALRGPIERSDAGWRVDVGTADGLAPIAGELPPLIDDHGDRWRIAKLEANHCILEPLNDLVPGDRRVLTLIDREAGRSATADQWAAAGQTINYEVTTRLSIRIDRVYLAPEPLRAADATASGGDQRTAPLRKAVIDLDVLRVGLQEQQVAADLSADAYGHGAEQVIPLVLEAGLPIVARSHADVGRLRELGVTNAKVQVDAPDETRAFYGFGDGTKNAALALRSELIHVKRVMPGQAVSYGYAWRATKRTTLGLVPLGYADAIPRRAFGRAYVSVGGAVVPVVGRIAMDQIVVDLSDIECWPGMPVHIWGTGTGDVRLQEWAEWTGLSPAALCATLGPRVHRVHVTSEPFESAGFGEPAVRVILNEQGDPA